MHMTTVNFYLRGMLLECVREERVMEREKTHKREAVLRMKRNNE